MPSIYTDCYTPRVTPEVTKETKEDRFSFHLTDGPVDKLHIAGLSRQDLARIYDAIGAALQDADGDAFTPSAETTVLAEPPPF